MQSLVHSQLFIYSVAVEIEPTPSSTPLSTRTKQSRPREEEVSPPKPQQKKAKVIETKIRHSAIPLAEPRVQTKSIHLNTLIVKDISITGFNGRRVFVPVESEAPTKTQTKTPSFYAAGQLLSTPIAFLMESVDAAARRALLNGKGRPQMDVKPSDGLLWVDKYSPKFFTDLLSDEVWLLTVIYLGD